MKIKLKIKEMFAISKLPRVTNIIGYKSALTKLFYEMLDTQEFCELIDYTEKLYQKKQKFIELINKVKSQSIPDSEKEESIKKILSDYEIENQDLIKLINDYLNNDEKEFEFEFNTLTVNAIKFILENQDTEISKLGLDSSLVNILVDFYAKKMS
ncbi:MAG: hypothetical protein ACOCV1_02340 [Bacillota bacterium]